MAAIIAIAVIAAAGVVSAQPNPSPHQRTVAEDNAIRSGGGAGVLLDNRSMIEIATGSNHFSCDLYRRLADDSGSDNLFFSPYSISSALAITYEGARGTTADEIRSILHLPANDTLRRGGFARIDAELTHDDQNCNLQTASALWVEKTYPLLPEYIALAEHWYSMNATNLDFAGAPDVSRQAINRWTGEQTGGKIRDLLPAGSIGPMTRLIITNAIFFKGAWADPFDADKTREAEFRVSANETMMVPMMHGDAVYPYGEFGTLQVLELAYAHEKGLSMLVLLPEEGSLTAAEETLDVQNLSMLRHSLTRERIDVYLPRFTLDAGYHLSPTLAAMGMPTAFSSGADFSGMDGTKNLFISDLVHGAFVDVNEEGTEAAAATGVIMNTSAAPPGFTPVFRADHPFIFLILDDGSGIILFMGRVVRPAAA
ncbi:MAG: serpin family protein [Methanoculleus sp.]|nr:serpin family protein [Methanoculleus sp.]